MMIEHSNKHITRTILIRKLAQRCQSLNLTMAKQVIDLFFEETVKALAQDKDVTLRGFGTFHSNIRSPCVSHDPKTNKAINLPSRRLIYFKPSKLLYKPLNQGNIS